MESYGKDNRKSDQPFVESETDHTQQVNLNEPLALGSSQSPGSESRDTAGRVEPKSTRVKYQTTEGETQSTRVEPIGGGGIDECAAGVNMEDEESSDSYDEQEVHDPLYRNRHFKKSNFREQKILRSASKTDTPDQPKYYRNRCEILCCPVCSLTIRPNQMESHLDSEIQNLYRIPYSKSSRGGKISKARFVAGHASSSAPPYAQAQPSTSGVGTFSGVDGSGSSFRSMCSTYRNYRRLKANRELRNQAKRWQVDLTDDVMCPVCNDPVIADSIDDLQGHVEICLRRQEGESSEDEEVDVEGDEYEWGGMKKVRVTSLLRSQGQLDALGTRVKKGDENAPVEVCLSDDMENFGAPQYWNEDLALPSTSEGDPEHPSTSGSSTQLSGQLPFECQNTIGSAEEMECQASSLEVPESANFQDSAKSRETSIIGALKERIQELEIKGTFICLICHGPYEVPLVSTVCWHVHCERCWMHSLATQKLCPQCKVIVSPTDLRRVYL